MIGAGYLLGSQLRAGGWKTDICCVHIPFGLAHRLLLNSAIPGGAVSV